MTTNNDRASLDEFNKELSRQNEVIRLRSINAELVTALQDCVCGLDAFLKHRGEYTDSRIIKAKSIINKALEI